MLHQYFSGETLIGVADGRSIVSIKQLADEAKDVPVYSFNYATREVGIEWAKNTRITGIDQTLLRVHFDNQSYIDVIPDYKFTTNDGRTVAAKNLQKGDSLAKFSRISSKDDYVRIYSNNKYKVEHRMIMNFLHPEEFMNNYTDGTINGCCKTNGVVVHHKDENKQNNLPENLEITTFSEHRKHHGTELVGNKNPMFGRQQSDHTKQMIGEDARKRCLDPEYREKLSQAQTPEMREIASKRMKIAKHAWDKETVAQQIQEAQKSGLKIMQVTDSLIHILLVCDNEKCNKEFEVKWSCRHQSHCSISCANTKKVSIEARKAGMKKTHEKKAKANFHKQVMIYKDLQAKTTIVSMKDWQKACRIQKVSIRFNAKSNNKWIANTWNDFKKMAQDYNHRVNRVEELPGLHSVYGTLVDNNRNLTIITHFSNERNIHGIFA